MIGERIKQARMATGLTQEEVAIKLGVNKVSISQLENNRAVTEHIEGDLIAALSHLFQVPYSFLISGEEDNSKSKSITSGEILDYISNHHLLSWNAKGLLFHIFWNERLQPSFNTLRQLSGDNYEQTQSGLNELLHYKMIFKYHISWDIEVYGFNRLIVCESIQIRSVLSVRGVV